MPSRSTYLTVLAVVVLSSALQAAPVGTSFTYQGKLVQNGVDVTDLCDFAFILWDSAAGGVEVGGPIDVFDVAVTEGNFTVELDFGGGMFEGDASWLEIAVACPPGGGLTLLEPRQELTPTPNALFAGSMRWEGLINIPEDIEDGDDVDDADADASNELQDLSLAGSTLSLTDDASPVDLSEFLDNTDDQNLAEVLAQGNNAGGASISNLGTATTNQLTVSGLNCTANANGGALTTNASGDVVCSDDDGGAGGGNTLDQAYDQGGPGAGRIINADAGTVTIQGASARALQLEGDFDPTLRVNASSNQGQDTGIQIVGARNANTTVDAAYIDLENFDDNEGIEGIGTEFTMARIGAGMADVSGQTGFMRFYTNAGADLQERMRIDKQGAVSIGSNAGTERLKVAGDASIGGGDGIGLQDGESEYLRIRGWLTDWYLGVRNFDNNIDNTFFIGRAQNDFDRFHFSWSGDLGIGTAPLADLHLASTGSLQLWMEADTDNMNEADQPRITLSQDGGVITGEFGFFDELNGVSLRSNDTGPGSSHIFIEPEGRVGIGTFSPQTFLDVQGPGGTAGGTGSPNVVSRFRNTSASPSTGISIDALSDQGSVLYWAENGNAHWSFSMIPDYPNHIDPILQLRYHENGVHTALVFSTRTDGQSFTIAPQSDDNTHLGSQLVGLGAWAGIVTHDLTNLSDERLKSDIVDLEYGIGDVMKLRPVSFQWKSRDDDDDHFGVIAQEVMEVLPEIVGGDESSPDTHMTVDYLALIPVLIRAIQEQQEEIESLHARMDSLQPNAQTLSDLP